MGILSVVMGNKGRQTFREWRRQLLTHESFHQGLCVLIAMTLAMLISAWYGRMNISIPLFLGIIACGLSERDERPMQRVGSLLQTLIGFSIAAISIELLMPYPLLFACGLGLSTFAITLSSAAGSRYNTMMSSVLVLAVYSMITVDQRHGALPEPLWRDGALLVAGAALYGVLSLGLLALSSRQVLPRHLVTLYAELGNYLSLKSSLFEPVKGRDAQQLRVALACQHRVVLQALSDAQDVVCQTLQATRLSRRAARDMRLFSRAEALFERASSSHFQYSGLLASFYHSDILFRCQRLLALQGEACRTLALTLRQQGNAKADSRRQAFDDLRDSFAHVRESGIYREVKVSVQALEALVTNLTVLETMLTSAETPNPEGDSLSTVPVLPQASMGTRLRLALTPRNPTFRHAVRLSAALVAGYLLLQALDPAQGFWILLTTVFVCRPTFGATHRILRQRIAGTIAGLIGAWALITLFPDPMIQCTIAVAAGVAFFMLRLRHYSLATGAITLMVLCCFNQIGNGYSLVLPRLIDTLLGAMIASLAVYCILPDWKGHRLERDSAAALRACGRYLSLLSQQYVTGRQDDSAYLQARREAHLTDTALSSCLSYLDQSPHHSNTALTVAGYQVLAQTNGLLGHLTALSVHRTQAPGTDEVKPLHAYAVELAASLETLANTLSDKQILFVDIAIPTFSATLPASQDDMARFLHAQLNAISEQLPIIVDAARALKQSEAG